MVPPAVATVGPVGAHHASAASYSSSSSVTWLEMLLVRSTLLVGTLSGLLLKAVVTVLARSATASANRLMRLLLDNVGGTVGGGIFDKPVVDVVNGNDFRRSGDGGDVVLNKSPGGIGRRRRRRLRIFGKLFDASASSSSSSFLSNNNASSCSYSLNTL